MKDASLRTRASGVLTSSWHPHVADARSESSGRRNHSSCRGRGDGRHRDSRPVLPSPRPSLFLLSEPPPECWPDGQAPRIGDPPTDPPPLRPGGLSELLLSAEFLPQFLEALHLLRIATPLDLLFRRLSVECRMQIEAAL